MLNIKKNCEGFSLLELAVVLVIMGSFILISLQVADKKAKQNQYVENKSRMDVVLNAMDKFVKRNGRVPCPANPRLRHTDANFGVERLSGGACVTDNEDEDYPNFGNSYNLHVGAVPVVTIGLPAEYIMDVWGSAYTYGVAADLVTEAAYAAGEGYIWVYHMGPDASYLQCVRAEDGNCDNSDPWAGGWMMTPEDDVSKWVHDSSPTQDAVYVLVSHGANLSSSWPGQGGSELRRNHGGLYSAETINSGSNLDWCTYDFCPREDGGDHYVNHAPVFVQVGVVQNQLESGTTSIPEYDDMVEYRTKSQLPTYCGSSCL
jgi:prepilin-type N-terminal cleavage/methylation domain-containing protein